MAAKRQVFMSACDGSCVCVCVRVYVYRRPVDTACMYGAGSSCSIPVVAGFVLLVVLKLLMYKLFSGDVEDTVPGLERFEARILGNGW